MEEPGLTAVLLLETEGQTPDGGKEERPISVNRRLELDFLCFLPVSGHYVDDTFRLIHV